mmetsp:Transcript_39428/g.64054  ORF Transcript_39428/g.64054 Transcript_39428/m.64054 type:complete len:116 (-) Transcript_39428:1252-1599(-)
MLSMARTPELPGPHRDVLAVCASLLWDSPFGCARALLQWGDLRTRFYDLQPGLNRMDFEVGHGCRRGFQVMGYVLGDSTAWGHPVAVPVTHRGFPGTGGWGDMCGCPACTANATG